MKELLIIRHAKSDWNNPGIPDFDRPLNARGQKNAPEMAKRLLKKNIAPDLFISSPSIRTMSTALTFAAVLGFDIKNIKLEKNIYEGSARSLLTVINNLDNTYNQVALFGHNPGLTDLVLKLCECDIYNIATGGMVLLKFECDDWNMISYGTADLCWYDYPKNNL